MVNSFNKFFNDLKSATSGMKTDNFSLNFLLFDTKRRFFTIVDFYLCGRLHNDENYSLSLLHGRASFLRTFYQPLPNVGGKKLCGYFS